MTNTWEAQSDAQLQRSLDAALKFWRLIPPGAAKDIAKRQILAGLNEKAKRRKVSRAYEEAAIWNEAFDYFRKGVV